MYNEQKDYFLFMSSSISLNVYTTNCIFIYILTEMCYL